MAAREEAGAIKGIEASTTPSSERGRIGSATFERGEGGETEAGFIMKLSMKADSGRPFTIYLEEGDLQAVPEDGQKPNVEYWIAARLAFWVYEMICHGTAEQLDGRAVDSGKWMKTWS